MINNILIIIYKLYIYIHIYIFIYYIYTYIHMQTPILQTTKVSFFRSWLGIEYNFWALDMFGYNKLEQVDTSEDTEETAFNITEEDLDEMFPPHIDRKEEMMRAKNTERKIDRTEKKIDSLEENSQKNIALVVKEIMNTDIEPLRKEIREILKKVNYLHSLGSIEKKKPLGSIERI